MEEDPIKVPAFTEEQSRYTPEQRSRLMSRIRSTDTRPELMLRRALWALGYRYRKDVKSLPGKPDIAVRKYKVAVFVDGEFWHGYKWAEKKPRIKRNREYWIPKIERNMQRDRQNTQALQEQGWTVFRFWEHKLKKEFHTCLEAVVEELEKKKRE
ncbi:MAG: very short patch repair endonuclease [Phaeodactylibacter sp.]|nr:very short patch repair endonuclease [Phaeodactylibacter sp.]MCB9266152.1 very short patch repair endonuclease [Lewinellaceae bacterium]MCB9286286.1 very short patch repair endonuclease [Lewinellaceae bacterium]